MFCLLIAVFWRSLHVQSKACGYQQCLFDLGSVCKQRQWIPYKSNIVGFRDKIAFWYIYIQITTYFKSNFRNCLICCLCTASQCCTLTGLKITALSIWCWRPWQSGWLRITITSGQPGNCRNWRVKVCVTDGRCEKWYSELN